MQIRLLHEAGGLRTFTMVLEIGEQAMSCLERAAREHGLSAAQITAIGAFSEATLMYFDWERKAYVPVPVPGQTEVASLIGDIALDSNGEPVVHVHVVLGKRDGSALAGHLKEAVVRPTLEIVITEAPSHLCRRHDPDSGLALIRPEG